MTVENGISPGTMLKDGAASFNTEINSDDIDKLFKYKDLLLEWNQKINLTAIEEETDIYIKHFIDSFSILPFLKGQKISMIDIGTGAGFPGIPVKIAQKEAEVVLLDSLDKRVGFLNNVINELKLKGIVALHGRAEDFGTRAEFREKFDVSVARAVAALPVLLEYCLPFVKTGGIFIAMKGSNTEEVDNSNKALEVLGGKVEEIRELILPFSDINRNIIIVRKYRQTPTKYPRKAGKPSKEPLI
jgi:16S rRNA (guanine(527)-N(7))-methyltransferase GidB